MLIHVGLETVRLGGKYFTCHMKEGQSFRKGDLLLEFDLDAITAEGFDTVTPVVVTNGDDYEDIVSVAGDRVKSQDDIFVCTPKRVERS